MSRKLEDLALQLACGEEHGAACHVCRAARARPEEVEVRELRVAGHDTDRGRTRTPSSSAATCASVVSCPCPCGICDVITVTRPSGSRRTRDGSFSIGKPIDVPPVGDTRSGLDRVGEPDPEIPAVLARAPLLLPESRVVERARARRRASPAPAPDTPSRLTASSTAARRSVSRFRRLTSIGSSPSSRATRSIIRSRTSVSDAPGPRYEM